MKKIILVLLFLMISLPIHTANNQKFGKIIVKIVNFENSNGVLRSHLYSSAVSKSFPTVSDDAFKNVVGKINKNKCTVVYDSIPYGTYALTVHHDEDNDGWMNKSFIGYPSEGYGMSNNPTIILSAPDFNDSKFKLNRKNVTIKVIMKN